MAAAVLKLFGRRAKTRTSPTLVFSRKTKTKPTSLTHHFSTGRHMTQSPEQQLQSAEREIAELQVATKDALSHGRVSEALELAQRAREQTVAYFGPRHAASASALNNVALVLKASGSTDNLKAALPLLEEAAQMYEELQGYGKKHASTATAYSNLGTLHLTLARNESGLAKVPHIEAGRAYHELALSARKETLGATHTMVGVSMYQLASALRLQRKFKEAESLLHESIALLRSSAGPRNTTTATAINNLGFLFKEMKDFARADAAYLEALEIRREKLGPSHPDTITAQNNLAECKRAAGDEDGAIKIQKDILQVLGVSDDHNEPEDARKLV